MKTFVYTATDVQGNTVKNARMSAEDVNDFLEKIHEKGLFCSSYKETKSKDSNTLHKFNLKELSYNCRQLSAMLTSGLTLVRALDILYKEQAKDAAKQVFRDVYEEVQKGSSFSDALKMQQGAFPDFFVSMVQAGESSGSLDVIVKRLELYYDKQNKLNSKIKSSLTYPIILGVLCVAVVILLCTFVLPMFRDLMGEDEMPALSKALFAFSDSLTGYWYIYLSVVLALVFLIYFGLKVPDVRYKFDKMICKMPKVGKLVVKVYTGRFARTLSSLYSSGIPMVESLERSAAILGNSFIEKGFRTVIDEVRQGEQLSVSMQRMGVFESMFCSIIYVGEESGALDTILEKSADFYEDESDEAITSLVSLIEPVMIIFMGLVVGMVLGAVFPLLYGGIGSIANG
ncbi:MAG: type II secretion system F family protein [Ruminococcus sp.]|nr:type II secretion system F family protein [Ruminococcus sp.]MCM1380416.1 type II secretion system F family protein [Muribaculaceae bacterium]MCM1478916.1 type II secretion system F family protein [Muribaculaceae bacterium]